MITEIINAKPSIESAFLIEDLLKLFESAFSSINELMPRDCYDAFSACLLRFLDAASFGDKASEAFELWLLSASITTSYNHCILAFGGEDAVSYSILHHLLLTLSNLLLPYYPRKALPLTAQPESLSHTQSTTSASTFSSYAIKLLQKAQEEKMAAMSVNDYQLTAKVLTVLRVHIPTLKSVQLRLWG